MSVTEVSPGLKSGDSLYFPGAEYLIWTGGDCILFPGKVQIKGWEEQKWRDSLSCVSPPFLPKLSKYEEFTCRFCFSKVSINTET